MGWAQLAGQPMGDYWSVLISINSEKRNRLERHRLNDLVFVQNNLSVEKGIYRLLDFHI